ncbi:MAG: hypothetical protein K0S61_1747 [Anaerocolumna sp.]|jgi:hypothetical protein|nr:hypothetical protein [Anaerocolumna sp.]
MQLPINKIVSIQPFQKSTFTCYYNDMATVALWLKRDYELMFSESWSFKYYENPTDTGKINPNNGYSFDIIRDYHGIKITKKTPCTFDELIETIETEILKGYPVIFSTNAYFCTWNPSYQKQYFPHFCLAIGVDFEAKEILCMDPYFTPEIISLPFQNLKDSYDHYFTFEKQDVKSIGSEWRDILHTTTNKVFGSNKDENTFYNIREFSKLFDSSFEIIEETSKFDNLLDFSPGLLVLTHVEWARFNVSSYFNYIANQCSVPELLEFSNQMVKASKNWSVLKSILCRACITKNNDLSKVAVKKIHEIADYEEEVANKLLEFIHK